MGLLIGVQAAVNRIHILWKCSVLSPGCCSPTCSVIPSCAAHDLVFWMRQERNGDFWQCPAQLGKLGAHSHICLSPAGEIMADKGSLGTRPCCLRGGVPWVRPNCSACTPQWVQSWIYFVVVPVVCWNFSGRLPDFYKGSLICR